MTNKYFFIEDGIMIEMSKAHHKPLVPIINIYIYVYIFIRISRCQRKYNDRNEKSSPQASGPSHQAALACPRQPEVLESVLGHFLSYFTWILYVPSSYSLTVLLSTIFLSYFTCIAYVPMLVLSLS